MAPVDVTSYTNREDYLRTKGVQAPPWREGGPIKLWESTPGRAYLAYKYLGKSGGKPVLLNAPAISVEDSGVNIPGLYLYMSWENWKLTRSSSRATVIMRTPMFANIPIPVDKAALFTPSEAAALAAEIGGVTYTEAADFNGVDAVYTYPDGDDRRVWTIKTPNGRLDSMSALFRQRTDQGVITPNSPGIRNNGVGSPGTWSVSDAGILFTAGPQATGELATDSVPLPCRPLKDNEELVSRPVGLWEEVGVQDKGEGVVISTVPPGNFSEADRQLLVQINAGMQALVTILSQGR